MTKTRKVVKTVLDMRYGSNHYLQVIFEFMPAVRTNTVVLSKKTDNEENVICLQKLEHVMEWRYENAREKAW